MRIAIAPNAFRGSLSASQAADCILAGLQQSSLQAFSAVKLPLADGGDGTLDILVDALGGEKLMIPVHGPDESIIQAPVGLLSDGKTAVLEMALASGVELIPVARRNPMITTTYGTGELILAALQRGYRKFLIGIGGSATVDGGAGCFQALGARLLDSVGNEIPHGGDGLAQLVSIDLSGLAVSPGEIDITILSDVTNPLLGDFGAARVFGPQKGALPEMVEQLELNLSLFADVIERDLGINVRPIAGGGAAGGFGAGLAAFLNAKITPGAAELITLLGYDRQIQGTDLIITGEGKLDSQTSGGKAVQCIAQIAAQHNIPVVAFAGRVDADQAALRTMGISAAWSIVPGPCTLESALANAPHWLTHSATMLGNLLAI